MIQLRHEVLLSFKEGAPVRDIEDALNALPSQIPQIKNYEWGRNIPANIKNKNFTHCFFLTFDNEADLATYETSKPHVAFKNTWGQYIGDEIIINYWKNNIGLVG